MPIFPQQTAPIDRNSTQDGRELILARSRLPGPCGGPAGGVTRLPGPTAILKLGKIFLS
jgi:hypothetical protein